MCAANDIYVSRRHHRTYVCCPNVYICRSVLVGASLLGRFHARSIRLSVRKSFCPSVCSVTCWPTSQPAQQWPACRCVYLSVYYQSLYYFYGYQEQRPLVDVAALVPAAAAVLLCGVDAASWCCQQCSFLWLVGSSFIVECDERRAASVVTATGTGNRTTPTFASRATPPQADNRLHRGIANTSRRSTSYCSFTGGQIFGPLSSISVSMLYFFDGHPDRYQGGYPDEYPD